MVKLIQSRQEVAGHKQLPYEIETFRAMSYIRSLKRVGIGVNDFEEVFDIAVEIYNKVQNQQSPFGIDYIIRAGNEFVERKKTRTIFTKPLKALPSYSCKDCKGSRISYKIQDGKLLGINYEMVDGKRIPRKCETCASN